MSKIKFTFIVVLAVFCMWFFGCANSGSITAEKAFSEMLGSSDTATRITAIVLVGDFKETTLIKVLENHLKNTSGVEKVAVLYSLSIYKNNYLDAFIESFPKDEKGIKELLKIESPEGSYFRAPHLRIISYLGNIAIYNDKALAVLKVIQPYADGWQGDLIMEFIMTADKSKK